MVDRPRDRRSDGGQKFLQLSLTHGVCKRVIALRLDALPQHHGGPGAGRKQFIVVAEDPGVGFEQRSFWVSVVGDIHGSTFVPVGRIGPLVTL